MYRTWGASQFISASDPVHSTRTLGVHYDLQKGDAAQNPGSSGSIPPVDNGNINKQSWIPQLSNYFLDKQLFVICCAGAASSDPHPLTFYLTYILTFHLAFCLAFCLIYILTFYLTFYLAYVWAHACPVASGARDRVRVHACPG